MKPLPVFTKEGLTLKVDAFKLIQRVLSQQGDESTQKELLSEVIADLKKNGTSLPIITKDCITGSLLRISQKQKEEDEDNQISVTDAFNFPQLQLNVSKNSFERIPPTNRKLHGEAKDKIEAMRDRIEIVRQRLLRNSMFTTKPNFTGVVQKDFKLVAIEELIGSKGAQCVVGALTLIDGENLFLEDLTGYVKLVVVDKQQIMPALYSEGMVVLAQGEVKDGILYADLIGQPRAESKEEFNTKFPSGVKKEKQVAIPETAQMVILSDIWLDKAPVVQKLRLLFEGYCKNQFIPELFVLIGNFHSVPVDSIGSNMDSYLKSFEKLAEVVQQFPDLANSKFVIVPGNHDPVCSGILPRPPISKRFTKPLQKLSNFIFASNPCRISYYKKDILIFRDDLLSKIQRTVILQDDIDFSEKDFSELYAQTVLNQAHLSPIPFTINPVYWNFDYALRMDILPDVLVLADKCEQFTTTYQDCLVINPSSFCIEHSFASFTPHSDEVNFSLIADSYAIVPEDSPSSEDEKNLTEDENDQPEGPELSEEEDALLESNESEHAQQEVDQPEENPEHESSDEEPVDDEDMMKEDPME